MNYKKNLESEAIVKNLSDYKIGETFEQLVSRKFYSFINKTTEDIWKKLSIKNSEKESKKFKMLSMAILGIKRKYILEFEKADVLMKIIRIPLNRNIKESFSYPPIQFTEIINENWEDSAWFNELNRRFFFVIFKMDSSGIYHLVKTMFWTIPSSDMDILEGVWDDTKSKIMENRFNDFIKISDNKIGHVRPKAQNSNDLMETATGSMEKKKCFWLNSSYIKKIIS